MPIQTDRELVEAAQSGSMEAFGALVRRHQKRVYRVAYHLLKNGAEAEDVTQDTFIRAYRAIGRFDGRCEPFTWMYRIAVNLSINTLRSRKNTKNSTPVEDPKAEVLLAEQLKGVGDPAQLNANRQLAEALLDGIDQLSETLRTTLILVSVDGLGHAEASEILGCPEGTVAWRIHEARRKLRAYLEKRGYPAEEGDDS